jgi:hypothetical protein
VTFVDHLSGIGGRFPLVRLPDECPGVDDHRRPKNTFRLVVRDEVGNRRRAIDGDFIEIADGSPRIEAEEVAGVLRLSQGNPVFFTTGLLHVHDE